MTRNPLFLVLALALAACGGSEPSPSASETMPATEATTPSPSPTETATPAPAWVAYIAQGDEPFWTVRTDGPGQITYFTPEQPDGVELTASMSSEGGWTRFEAKLDGAPLVLEVHKAKCLGGMSGFEFSHEAKLTRADGTWPGCARLASEAQPHE